MGLEPIICSKPSESDISDEAACITVSSSLLSGCSSLRCRQQHVGAIELPTPATRSSYTVQVHLEDARPSDTQQHIRHSLLSFWRPTSTGHQVAVSQSATSKVQKSKPPTCKALIVDAHVAYACPLRAVPIV